MWEFLYDWEVWSLWPPSTCIAIYLIRHFPKDWKWCYVVSAVNSGCWKKLAGKNVVYSLICWYLLQMARGCLNFLSSSILQSRLSCRKNSHGWLIYTEVRFCLTFLSIRLVCVGEMYLLILTSALVDSLFSDFFYWLSHPLFVYIQFISHSQIAVVCADRTLFQCMIVAYWCAVVFLVQAVLILFATFLPLVLFGAIQQCHRCVSIYWLGVCPVSVWLLG